MIETIMEGGIENINVVLGAYHDQITAILSDRLVKVLNNPQWESGISSSIKTGVKNLNKNIDAVFIFVVDQPFINSKLIKKIENLFHFTNAKIIANRVNGNQTHPVLFRIDVAEKLLNLADEQGGRQLIEQNKVLWLDSIENKFSLDIDSPEDLILLNQDHDHPNGPL